MVTSEVLGVIVRSPSPGMEEVVVGWLLCSFLTTHFSATTARLVVVGLTEMKTNPVLKRRTETLK